MTKMTNMIDMTAFEPEKEMTKGRLTTAILVGLLTSRLAKIPNKSDAFLQKLTKRSRKRSWSVKMCFCDLASEVKVNLTITENR